MYLNSATSRPMYILFGYMEPYASVIAFFDFNDGTPVPSMKFAQALSLPADTRQHVRFALVAPVFECFVGSRTASLLVVIIIVMMTIKIVILVIKVIVLIIVRIVISFIGIGEDEISNPKLSEVLAVLAAKVETV